MGKRLFVGIPYLALVVATCAAFGQPPSSAFRIPASEAGSRTWPMAPSTAASEAPVQILRPTTSAAVWDVVGSRNGTDWETLGSFFLLAGKVPLGTSDALASEQSLPTPEIVVGHLTYASGEEIPYVVASLVRFDRDATLLEDALAFHLLNVAGDLRQAMEDAADLADAVESLRGFDGSDFLQTFTTEELPPGVCQSSGDYLLGAKAFDCASTCADARAQRAAVCQSAYGTCITAVTAALSLCLITCPPTGVGCAVCFGSYAIALAVCDANYGYCLDNAQIAYNQCMAGCPSSSGDDTSPLPEDRGGEQYSPIILDLDGDGFHLAGTEDPVLFDISGEGREEWISWTQGGTIDAFLALDWNGNGTIDSGRELFGNASLLSDGTIAPHGFVALGELDENHDGAIDGADLPWFDYLVVWIDDDHDGTSQSDELLSLAEAGVVSIDLRFVESRRRDRHGNEFRYKSQARILWRGAGARIVQVSDVFFRVAD